MNSRGKPGIGAISTLPPWATRSACDSPAPPLTGGRPPGDHLVQRETRGKDVGGGGPSTAGLTAEVQPAQTGR